jgi:hypothetical protein
MTTPHDPAPCPECGGAGTVLVNVLPLDAFGCPQDIIEAACPACSAEAGHRIGLPEFDALSRAALSPAPVTAEDFLPSSRAALEDRPMSDRIMQEREISADAANRIGILLDSIERVLTREQEAAQARVDHADERDSQGYRIMAFPGLPSALRWRVMVLGSSVEDMNFWVRHDPDEPDVKWFIATEIETGTHAHGVSAREALDNYFSGANGPGGMSGT